MEKKHIYPIDESYYIPESANNEILNILNEENVFVPDGIDDEEYVRRCFNIAEKIIDFINRDISGSFSLYQIKAPEESLSICLNKLYGFEYRLNFNWISDLRIYLSESTIEAQSCISNTCQIRKADGKEKITKREFYFTNNTNEYIPPIIKTTDKIIHASVLIQFIKGKKYSKKYFTIMIMHELGHLYDAYKNNTDFLFINRDLLNFNLGFSENEWINNFKDATERFKAHLDYQSSRMLCFDFDTNLEEKREFISSEYMNSDIIALCIKRLIYNLNSSEEKQRVMNFLYDISELSSNQVKEFRKYIFKENENIIKTISRYSKTYAEYRNIIILFGYFKKYVSPKIKKDFLDRYFNKYNDEYDVDTINDNGVIKDITYKRAYNTDFSNNGIITEKTFDKFMDFHINQIKNGFLEPVYNIINHIEYVLTVLKKSINETYLISNDDAFFGRGYNESNRYVIHL